MCKEILLLRTYLTSEELRPKDHSDKMTIFQLLKNKESRKVIIRVCNN
jgi:hypothetical protein